MRVSRLGLVTLGAVTCFGTAFADSEPLEGSKPDYVVYRPQQPRGGKNADPKPRAVWQQPMLAKSGRLYCLWNLPLMGL